MERRLDRYYSETDFDSRLDKYTHDIKCYMYEASKSFVSIGFLLHEVDIYRYYTLKGYKNVYEYASSELGFKKSSTNNFLNICRKFCDNTATGWHILSKYERFKYSQLVEMLSMNDKQLALVTPETTVKEMRDLKHSDDSFQTSGKVRDGSVRSKTALNCCSSCWNLKSNMISLRDINGELFDVIEINYCPFCGRFLDELVSF